MGKTKNSNCVLYYTRLLAPHVPFIVCIVSSASFFCKPTREIKFSPTPNVVSRTFCGQNKHEFSSQPCCAKFAPTLLK